MAERKIFSLIIVYSVTQKYVDAHIYTNMKACFQKGKFHVSHGFFPLQFGESENLLP